MKRIFILLLSLTLSPGISVGAGELSPHEVAEGFWAAIKTNDIPTLRKYIASRSLKKEDLATHLPSIGNVELGKTLIEEDRAWVETSVVMRRNESESITIPLETMLIKENGQWKVLYEETVMMITETSELARFLDRLGDLTEQFGQRFDRSLGELQRSLPEAEQELRELEEKLKAQLPEIKDRLEGLMKELEELLKPFQQTQPSEEERAI